MSWLSSTALPADLSFPADLFVYKMHLNSVLAGKCLISLAQYCIFLAFSQSWYKDFLKTSLAKAF